MRIRTAVAALSLAALGLFGFAGAAHADTHIIFTNACGGGPDVGAICFFGQQ
ncbi:hypothetical protein [Streptomyces scopuliridis]|uniref:hypothetical protein n=1 Tax=Streptomyces scopuliridis TaxID=452529 RepID=UPI00342E8157